MKFLLAPDSFKECMAAQEAARIMQQAVLRALPDAQTVLLPLADGGEGTAETLAEATYGTIHETEVTGPLGKPVAARYAILGDGKTAVVEMAQASGLHLIPPAERNPLCTTSYGTGELMLAALAHKPETLLVTIGGSATNDGGIGMLQALGVKAQDADGEEIPLGGAGLEKLAQIDISSLSPQLAQTKVKIACDVTNPLVGPRGASRVFGPQKGATPAMVEQLEANLLHLAALIEQTAGLSLYDVPGAGAAGGMGAALLLCGGTLVPGIELVLDLLSFDEQVRTADYVLTGEGKIDDQTPDGKVIAGVVKRSKQAGVPVIAFAGTVLPGYEPLYERGLLSVNSIIPKPCTLEEALADGKSFLFQAVENVVRTLGSQRNRAQP